MTPGEQKSLFKCVEALLKASDRRRLKGLEETADEFERAARLLAVECNCETHSRA